MSKRPKHWWDKIAAAQTAGKITFREAVDCYRGVHVLDGAFLWIDCAFPERLYPGRAAKVSEQGA